MHGEQLQYSDPTWLRDLLRGCIAMGGVYLASAVAALFLLAQPLSVLASRRAVPTTPRFLTAGLLAAFAVANLLAHGLFTVPDPRALPTESPSSTRRRIRWVAAVSTALLLLASLLVAALPSWQDFGLRRGILGLSLVVAALAWPALAYAQELQGRLTTDRLERQAARLRIVLLAVLFAGLAMLFDDVRVFAADWAAEHPSTWLGISIKFLSWVIGVPLRGLAVVSLYLYPFLLLWAAFGLAIIFFRLCKHLRTTRGIAENVLDQDLQQLRNAPKKRPPEPQQIDLA
jgi:hypothetical protein